MKNKIENILLKNVAPQADENIKKQTIETLNFEIQKTTILKKEKFISMLLKQFSYMSKTIFIIQFILLIIGLLIIKTYSFKDTNVFITFIVAILSLIQILETEKSFKYKMYEIEMSSKIDLKKLIALRSIILSSINLCIMTIFGGLMGVKFEYEISLMIIHFLVPFLVINAVNIEISKRFKTNEISKMFLSLSISTLLVLLHIQNPIIYEKSSIAIWIITLCVSLIILIKNWYELWSKEEEFIWNLQ